MKTWQYFVESKESEEEKVGMDLDHDGEKGEAKSHKDKIQKKHKENIEFFKNRKNGAMKIAAEAKSKGGAAILTYYHFSAKAEPYLEVIRAIESNKEKKFFLSKFNALLPKLKLEKLSEKEFQELMGKMEVFGEAFSYFSDLE